MCDKWYGVYYVHHSRTAEHFLSFTGFEGSRKSLKVRGLVWLILIWNIWKHINVIIFKNRKCDIIEVFAMAEVKSWAVIKAKFKNVTFSY